MIILGVILLLLGYFLAIQPLLYVGIALVVIGAVLFALGAAGRPVGGRRYYY